MVDAATSLPVANEVVDASSPSSPPPCINEAPHASLNKAVLKGQSALVTALVRYTCPLLETTPLLSIIYAIVMMVFLPSPKLTLGLIVGVNLFLNLQSFNKNWR